jgi:hypothetical protein
LIAIFFQDLEWLARAVKVSFNRPDRNGQRLGDLAGGVSLRDEIGDLPLA